MSEADRTAGPGPGHDPAGPRLVAAARGLLPGISLGLVLAVGLQLVAARSAPRGEVLLFLVGIVGLVLLPLWAMSSLVALVRPPRTETRPWKRIGLLQGAALAVTAVGALVMEPLVDRLVPVRIGWRDEIVADGAVLTAAGLGALAVLVGSRLRERGEPTPWWILATQWTLVYGLVAHSLASSLPGRAWAFDVVTYGVAATCLHGLTPRVMGTRAGLVGAAGLAVALACAVFTFVAFGRSAVARAELVRAHPGPARVLAGLRGYLDMDGDGFASALGGPDCDDANPDVHPAMVEIVGNGVDDNCVGGDLATFEHHISGPPPPPPPGFEPRSLVLVTVDALRADALDEVAGRAVAAPRIRAQAEAGAWLTRAYASAPFTDHSMRSMFTGHDPMDYELLGQFLGHEGMLAEHLRSRGYSTSAVSQAFQLNLYLLEGFDAVDDSLAVENMLFEGRTSERTTDLALAQLEELRAAGRPFFLWVHYFDPHESYMAHDGTPFPGTEESDRYWQEVWVTDREIGRFIDGLGPEFLDDGILAITSDHGELIGEGGRFGHALWTDEAILRVPLVLRGAGVPRGRSDARVGLVDLMPTLTELAVGVELPVHGHSLLPVLRGEETADRDVLVRNVYTGKLLPPMLVRVGYHGDHKLVQDLLAGVDALYDVRTDPDQKSNLIDTEPETAAAVRAVLGARWDRSVNNKALARKAALLPGRRLPPDRIQAYHRRVLEAECARGYADACADLRGP